MEIISPLPTKDAEGFVTEGDTLLASVKAYKEDQHGNERWSNMAAFSEATSLFRFRAIPGLTITTEMLFTCEDGRYEITSVEDVRSRKMYLEVLGKKVISSG
ncbi:MAG: head-tail adaptor protein [Mobilitalea sp.]